VSFERGTIDRRTLGIVGLLAALLVPFSKLRADELIGATSTTMGRIMSVSTAGVTFAPGCSGGTPHTYGWDEIQEVSIDPSNCSGSFPAPQRSGATAACAGNKPPVAVVGIYFENVGSAYATTLDTDSSGDLSLGLAGGRGSIKGPLKDARKLGRATICTEDLSKQKWPASYK
jgi:hypothetical protein